ncbi:MULTISPECIES: LEA type 2 family protein [Cellvibrio]|uniref:LEA14-like dessication related protein n=1 Tax=Cellvibrio fibrivorans TaxID=126350 RepID=A0ABU1USK4_9GAMM|nr:LEA type 2 family protein [Cellvibrio fibrivorans]MDR7088123.1 LEA14-like dessication related protein [Cellvibrio fibrivorans]
MSFIFCVQTLLRRIVTPAVVVNTKRLVIGFFITCSLGLAGCSSLQPKLEQPTVKVAGLQLLPAQGLSQPIEVSLLIANPNDRDLTLRGMSYTVGIENFDVLSGVSNQLPTLAAYQETPVKVVVTANVLQLVRLIEHFGRNGVKENVNYNFSAKLDFSAWLPALRINEKGMIPLAAKKR